jgi:hypothetical protein
MCCQQAVRSLSDALSGRSAVLKRWPDVFVLTQSNHAGLANDPLTVLYWVCGAAHDPIGCGVPRGIIQPKMALAPATAWAPMKFSPLSVREVLGRARAWRLVP